ncbi:hypothetical protein OURE66S_02689 [Oligella ureolytica]
MDLKGAVLRNFYGVGTLVTESTPTETFSLKVPHYQRPYKWNAESVGLLINDWKDNRKISTDNALDYFAGAVVTVARQDAKEHSLIDGQQRVTTLFLANYINFILIRYLILFDIKEGHCGKIESLSERLNDSAKFLFRDEALVKEFADTAKFIKGYSDDDKMALLHKSIKQYEEDDSKFDSVNPIDMFYDLLWLRKPKLDIVNGKIDEIELKKSTVNFLSTRIKEDSLNLHYDRASYNTSLAKVLIHFYIDSSSGILPKVIDEENMSESELVYTIALKKILLEFKTITPVSPEESLKKYIFNIHQMITSFLSQVKLCVIQTGAVDDAYTLFEVMNDRALALDDLDLIKNQFFKEFVQKNTLLDDIALDLEIQSLEKQWGDCIFNHRKARDQDKKLVSYLGTVFLTGNETISNKRNEKYRVFLNDDYFKNNSSYELNDIQRDFNVFQICFELINELDLPYNKRENISLGVEYDSQSTEFKKTVYFLNALKQDGVLSGLINFVLKTIAIFTDVRSSNNPLTQSAFELDFSIKFIKLLLVNGINIEKIKKTYPNYSNKTIEEIFKAVDIVQKQSKIIGTTSMMASNADIPRDLAKEIIEKYSLQSGVINQSMRAIMPGDTADLKVKFKQWLNNWSYERDSSFRLKTLFAKLLKFDLKGNSLVQTPIIITINTNLIEELELDHLVPQNSKFKSVISLEDADSEHYMHSIANMMPLPKKENVQKSNYPLEESLKFYEDSGLSKHFLLDDLQQLLTEVKDGSINSSKFFSKRKELLIGYFEQIMDF